MSRRQLSVAEINHLRRLIGWVRCEIGQDPDEMLAMLRDLAEKISPVDAAGVARLREAHEKAAKVPGYIRAGIKALSETVERLQGQVVDAPSRRVNEITEVPRQ